MVGLRALPNNRTSSDNWETAKDQKYQSNVRNARRKKTSQKNEDEAYSVKWELEQDGIKG